jgi:hypothetical protein
VSRRAHRPDPALRRQVETMAAYGIPEADIALVVGIDPKTLRKHYRQELDLAQTKANAQVAGFLFNSARNGNVTAQIFWLKTRACWKEAPSEHRHVAALGTFDLRTMSDEELERRIFGKPLELPGLSKLERSEALAPVVSAMLATAQAKKDEESGGN